MKKHTQYLRAEHEAAKQQTIGARQLQIVHEFDHEPTYIVTCDDDHMDVATVEPSTPNAVEVADELVRRWNAFPDLLAALEAIRDGLNGCESTDELRNTAGMCIVQARAAINKAKTL